MYPQVKYNELGERIMAATGADAKTIPHSANITNQTSAFGSNFQPNQTEKFSLTSPLLGEAPPASQQVPRDAATPAGKSTLPSFSLSSPEVSNSGVAQSGPKAVIRRHNNEVVVGPVGTTLTMGPSVSIFDGTLKVLGSLFVVGVGAIIAWATSKGDDAPAAPPATTATGDTVPVAQPVANDGTSTTVPPSVANDVERPSTPYPGEGADADVLEKWLESLPANEQAIWRPHVEAVLHEQSWGPVRERTPRSQ
jgi:hypothetical protein